MSTAATEFLNQPTLTVPELAQTLRISKNAAYGLVREGKVRVLRVGKRIVVPSSAVRELLGDS